MHGRGSERETGEWRGQPVLFTLPRNVVYPALLPMMRTPRLPVVDLTEAPADLNGLACFAERSHLFSAHVPSHFKRSLCITSSQNLSYSRFLKLVLYDCSDEGVDRLQSVYLQWSTQIHKREHSRTEWDSNSLSRSPSCRTQEKPHTFRPPWKTTSNQCLCQLQIFSYSLSMALERCM